MNKAIFQKVLVSLLFCFLSSTIAFAAAPPEGDGNAGTDTPTNEEPQVNPEDDISDLGDEHLYEHDTEVFDSGVSINERANRTEPPCEGVPANQRIRTDNNKGWHRVECSQVAASITEDELVRSECECYITETVRDAGCFDPETMIMMGDKSLKPIKYVRIGDMVWNPVLKKAQKVIHTMAGPEKLPLIEVGFGSSRIKITQTHPLVVRRNAAGLETVALRAGDSEDSWVIKANELREDDFVLAADNTFQRVTSLRELPVDQHQIVFNFEVEGDDHGVASHMIVANGIASPDVRIQAALNGDELPWEEK